MKYNTPATILCNNSRDMGTKRYILINDDTEIRNKEWTGDYCTGEVIKIRMVGCTKV